MNGGTDSDPRSSLRRTYVREGALLFGFVLLLAAATVSVVVPELAKEPDPEEPARPGEPAEQTAQAADSTAR